MDPIDDCSDSVQKLITPTRTNLYEFSMFKVDDGKTVFFPGHCFNCKSENVVINNPLLVDKVLVGCPNSLLYVDGICMNVFKSNPCGNNPTAYDLSSLKECQPYKTVNSDRKVTLPMFCSNHRTNDLYTSQQRVFFMNINHNNEIHSWINKWMQLIESSAYKNNDVEIVEAANKLDYSIIQQLDELSRIKSRKEKEDNAFKTARGTWVRYQENSKTLAVNSLNIILVLYGCSGNSSNKPSWMIHRLYVKCCLDGCNKMLLLENVCNENKLGLYCTIDESEGIRGGFKKFKPDDEAREKDNCLPLSYIRLKKLESKVMPKEYQLALSLAYGNLGPNFSNEDASEKKLERGVNMASIDELIKRANAN